MADKPRMILVIRHAEKPDDPADPDLAPAGQARAAALALYVPATFGKPDFIFAAANSKRSARPYETVRPLAQRVGVQINATVADDDYQKLADHLLSDAPYTGKFILVCWHHGHIPDLMRALGAAQGTFPDPWDPAAFGIILKVEFKGGAAVSTIEEPF